MSGSVLFDQIGPFDRITGFPVDASAEAAGWVPLFGGKVYHCEETDGRYEFTLCDIREFDGCDLFCAILSTVIHVIKNLLTFIIFPWLICAYKARDDARLKFKFVDQTATATS